MSLRMNTEFVV